MNQPATIKAAEWDTIAGAVECGDLIARYIGSPSETVSRIISRVQGNIYNYIDENYIHSDGVNGTRGEILLYPDDVLKLEWRIIPHPAPPASTIEALFAAIEGELYDQCPDCLGDGIANGLLNELCKTCEGGGIIKNAKGRETLAQLRQQMQAMEADIKDLHLTMRVHHSYLETIRERAGNGARYTDKQARREILDWTLYSLRELNPWLWKFEDAHNMSPATDNPRFVPPDEKQS